MVSSGITIFTFPFTADDNRPKKSIILIYHYIHVLIRHDINPSMINFARQFDRVIMSYFCIMRLLYQASVHNTFHVIWSAMLSRLSKCYPIQNNGQSSYWTSDPSPMVEIIDIHNDAFHEPIPAHQLNILWQMYFKICIYIWPSTCQQINFPWTRC